MMLRALALLLVIANLALFLQGRAMNDEADPGSRPAAPARADAPRTLRLLEEVPIPEGRSARMPTAGSASRHCERMGPFDSRAEAEAAAARADGRDLAAAVQVRRVVDGAPDHQVYLPPLASLDRARLRVRELRALGIDSFVMDGSGLEGAISIGLFTARERAEVRRDEVSGLGYEVRIRTLERTRERTVIRVRGADAAALDLLYRLLQADHPGLERTVVDCDPGGAEASAPERRTTRASRTVVDKWVRVSLDSALAATRRAPP